MIEFKENKITKQKSIYFSISFIVIIIVIAIVAIKLLQYNEEGEKNLPFLISKITVISTADGIEKEETQNKWDLSILQNNDIYIEIEKKENENRNDFFKKVTLENFKIIENPQKGEITFYQPTNDKDIIYEYREENKTNEKVEYAVGKNNNLKKLEITKDSGIVSFSACVNNLENYISNEETEIKYDGSLLKKINVKEEEIKFKISFDLLIEMESNKEYKATFTLELPNGNIEAEGIVKKEITDFKDVIFKRT